MSAVCPSQGQLFEQYVYTPLKKIVTYLTLANVSECIKIKVGFLSKMAEKARRPCLLVIFRPLKREILAL